MPPRPSNRVSIDRNLELRTKASESPSDRAKARLSFNGANDLAPLSDLGTRQQINGNGNNGNNENSSASHENSTAGRDANGNDDLYSFLDNGLPSLEFFNKVLELPPPALAHREATRLPDQLYGGFPKSIVDAVRRDVPSAIRGRLWKHLARLEYRSRTPANVFETMKSEPSRFDKLIRRDLPRTFPSHAAFAAGQPARNAMFNVMRAYSVYDAEVGYCQGLAFVAGPLVLHVNEHEAFDLLIRLLNDYGFRSHYTTNMEGLQVRLSQFECLMYDIAPKVATHLASCGINSTMYATQWFMTMFGYRLPMPCLLRVFDVVFAEGITALLKMSLALIIHKESHLLQLDFEKLVPYLKHDIFDGFCEDENALIQAMQSIDIADVSLSSLGGRRDTILGNPASPDYLDASKLSPIDDLEIQSEMSQAATTELGEKAAVLVSSVNLDEPSGRKFFVGENTLANQNRKSTKKEVTQECGPEMIAILRQENEKLEDHIKQLETDMEAISKEQSELVHEIKQTEIEAEQRRKNRATSNFEQSKHSSKGRSSTRATLTPPEEYMMSDFPEPSSAPPQPTQSRKKQGLGTPPPFNMSNSEETSLTLSASEQESKSDELQSRVKSPAKSKNRKNKKLKTENFDSLNQTLSECAGKESEKEVVQEVEDHLDAVLVSNAITIPSPEHISAMSEYFESKSVRCSLQSDVEIVPAKTDISQEDIHNISAGIIGAYSQPLGSSPTTETTEMIAGSAQENENNTSVTEILQTIQTSIDELHGRSHFSEKNDSNFATSSAVSSPLSQTNDLQAEGKEQGGSTPKKQGRGFHGSFQSLRQAAARLVLPAQPFSAAIINGVRKATVLASSIGSGALAPASTTPPTSEPPAQAPVSAPAYPVSRDTRHPEVAESHSAKIFESGSPRRSRSSRISQAKMPEDPETRALKDLNEMLTLQLYQMQDELDEARMRYRESEVKRAELQEKIAQLERLASASSFGQGTPNAEGTTSSETEPTAIHVDSLAPSSVTQLMSPEAKSSPRKSGNKNKSN